MFDETIRAKQLARIASIASSFEKGKALPEGTIRKWNGKEFIKQSGKWVPHTGGKQKAADEDGKKKGSKEVSSSNKTKKQEDAKQKDGKKVSTAHTSLTEFEDKVKNASTDHLKQFAEDESQHQDLRTKAQAELDRRSGKSEQKGSDKKGVEEAYAKTQEGKPTDTQKKLTAKEVSNMPRKEYLKVIRGIAKERYGKMVDAQTLDNIVRIGNSQNSQKKSEAQMEKAIAKILPYKEALEARLGRSLNKGDIFYASTHFGTGAVKFEGYSYDMGRAFMLIRSHNAKSGWSPDIGGLNKPELKKVSNEPFKEGQDRAVTDDTDNYLVESLDLPQSVADDLKEDLREMDFFRLNRAIQHLDTAMEQDGFEGAMENLEYLTPQYDTVDEAKDYFEQYALLIEEHMENEGITDPRASSAIFDVKLALGRTPSWS